MTGEPVRPTAQREQVLTVGIEDEQLVIRIGIDALAFALNQQDDPMRVVDPVLAADEIVKELKREEEDGTTPVHKLLDKAGYDAWENGGFGFADDDDE